jgi:hypothetical protein
VEGHRDGPCATGGWHNSMALWPSWPPLVRSAGPLPHSRRTWCILGDPARSGQPRRRSKSHATVGQELHEAHRRAGRDLHRTGLGSPVGWPVRPPEPTGQLKHAFPRMRPANRRTPRPVDRPSRGVRASDTNGPGSSSRGSLWRVHKRERLPAVIRYADARAWRGAPRPPAADAPPAACAVGHPGPGWRFASLDR